ncbi:MAG: hypothetical protein LBU27_04075 [Candidatus Peribacteria bacterium]|jgi:hypothetical protein|nr:hypothetical protein [Candidatus Peribacteria bacterium]
MKTQKEVQKQLTVEISRIKRNRATLPWVVVLIGFTSIVGLVIMALQRDILFVGDVLVGVLVIFGVGAGSWYGISSYYGRKYQNYVPTSAELVQLVEEKLFYIYNSLADVDREREPFLRGQKQELRNFLLELPDLTEEEKEKIRLFLFTLDNRSWG